MIALAVVCVAQLVLIYHLLLLHHRERTRLINAALADRPEQYIAMQAVSERPKYKVRNKAKSETPPTRTPKALGL